MNMDPELPIGTLAKMWYLGLHVKAFGVHSTTPRLVRLVDYKEGVYIGDTVFYNAAGAIGRLTTTARILKMAKTP
jgi:hypothetical protein